MTRELIFCADLHGQFPWLVNRLVNELKLTHVSCIVLGDFGVGFDNSLNDTYNKYKKKLEDADVIIYAMRGNHDDPKYFQDEKEYSKSNLIFMEDYKIYNICDREILPIGGAVSIDKNLRKEGKSWWPDENIKKVEKKHWPIKVDVIISHEAPGIFDPIQTKLEIDSEDEEYSNKLYEDISNDRNYLTEVAENVKADYWFYGHYHKHYSGEYKSIKYRCLGINEKLIPELFECPEKITHSPQGEL